MKLIRSRLGLWGITFSFALAYLFLLQAKAGDETEKYPRPPSKGMSVPVLKPSEPLSKGLGEDIPDWRARWELAKLLSYVKRYDESITEYKKVIQERPLLFEARAEMAQVLFWQGKPQEALKELEQIPSNSVDDRTRVLMADLYAIQKEYEKAEPLYRAYLKMHGQDDKVRLKLAEVLSWNKKYDASLIEYETILKTRPDDIQVRRKYAFVLTWAGKHNEAVVELRKTLK